MQLKLSILVAALFATSAPAHDWYPATCCNETDCEPGPVTDVKLIDGKYLVTWGGQTIEYDRARPSPDGDYHICTSGGRKNGSLIDNRNVDGVVGPCFWAPQGF